MSCINFIHIKTAPLLTAGPSAPTPTNRPSSSFGVVVIVVPAVIILLVLLAILTVLSICLVVLYRQRRLKIEIASHHTTYSQRDSFTYHSQSVTVV